MQTSIKEQTKPICVFNFQFRCRTSNSNFTQEAIQQIIQTTLQTNLTKVVSFTDFVVEFLSKISSSSLQFLNSTTFNHMSNYKQNCCLLHQCIGLTHTSELKSIFLCNVLLAQLNVNFGFLKFNCEIFFLVRSPSFKLLLVLPILMNHLI